MELCSRPNPEDLIVFVVEGKNDSFLDLYTHCQENLLKVKKLSVLLMGV